MSRLIKQKEALNYLYENSGIALQQAGTVLAAKLPVIATVAFSSLLFVPQLREVGALGMRASALYTAGALTLFEWNDTSALQKALNLAKVGAIALGIIGLTTGSTAFMITGMAVDTALQMLTLVEAAYILSSDNLFQEEKTVIEAQAICTILNLMVYIFVINSLCAGLTIPFLIGGLMSAASLTGYVISRPVRIEENENKNIKTAEIVIDVVGHLVLAVFAFVQTLQFNPNSTSPLPKGMRVHAEIHGNRGWNQIRVAANQTSTSIDCTKSSQYAEYMLSRQAKEKVTPASLGISPLYDIPGFLVPNSSDSL